MVVEANLYQELGMIECMKLELHRTSVTYWPFTDYLTLVQQSDGKPIVFMSVVHNLADIQKSVAHCHVVTEPNTLLFIIRNPCRAGNSKIFGKHGDIGLITGPDHDLLMLPGTKTYKSTISQCGTADKSSVIYSVRDCETNRLIAVMQGGRDMSHLKIVQKISLSPDEKTLLLSAAVRYWYQSTHLNRAKTADCETANTSKGVVERCYRTPGQSHFTWVGQNNSFIMTRSVCLHADAELVLKQFSKLVLRKIGNQPPAINFYGFYDEAGAIQLVVEYNKSSSKFSAKSPQNLLNVFSATVEGLMEKVYTGDNRFIGCRNAMNFYDNNEIGLATARVDNKGYKIATQSPLIIRLDSFGSGEKDVAEISQGSSIDHLYVTLNQKLDPRMKAMFLCFAVRQALAYFNLWKAEAPIVSGIGNLDIPRADQQAGF